MATLGEKVRDKITGFEGIATARTEYLFECVRVCVETLQDGKPTEAWFDEQRLDMSIPSSPTAGGPVPLAARPSV